MLQQEAVADSREHLGEETLPMRAAAMKAEAFQT
jgi:hypothetical protein